MKKLAIFVEGQTELIFVRRLLEELAGAANIVFHEQRRYAGTYTVLTSAPVNLQVYEVLIVDCMGDSAVGSAIIDQHATLTQAGYADIIGLRDLYPHSRHDLHALIQATNSVLPQIGCSSVVVVATAEVEAWFVQEDTHFPRTDANLNRQNILNSIGYDIQTEIAENLHWPTQKLRQIYGVVGRSYRKKKKSVSGLVNRLDYAHLYLDRRFMMPSFDFFVSRLEAFLT